MADVWVSDDGVTWHRSPPSLRCSYALSGTHVAYAASSLRFVRCSRSCVVLRSGMAVRAEQYCEAVCGTESGYGGTRRVTDASPMGPRSAFACASHI
eukprot:2217201-Rhodomonas_salina.1